MRTDVEAGCSGKDPMAHEGVCIQCTARHVNLPSSRSELADFGKLSSKAYKHNSSLVCWTIWGGR